MSRLAVRLEMPENCNKCRFSYDFRGVKKCNLLHVIRESAVLSQDGFGNKRDKKCPLILIPDGSDDLRKSRNPNYNAKFLIPPRVEL